MSKGVIFDLDDTLYLEADYVRSGFRAVAEWLDSRQPTADCRRQIEQELWTLYRRNPSRVFDRWVERLGTDSCLGLTRDELVKRMVEIYRRHKPDIQPCPDVVPALVRMSHHQLAILSDGEPERQEQKLAALGIEHLFRHVLFAGHDSEWRKPSSAGFQRLAGLLGLQPLDCVYVADNPAKDFAGPCEIGMRTVRIRRSGGLHERAECAPGFEPEETLSDFRSLPEAIERLGNGPEPGYPVSLLELANRRLRGFPQNHNRCNLRNLRLRPLHGESR